ncbi:HNH endonuclease [Rhizobium brockwellii]|nr:HNH endonuclease [Rhizobium brockwellii]
MAASYTASILPGNRTAGHFALSLHHGWNVMKTGVKRELLLKIFQKQDGKCCYCDRPMVIMPRGCRQNRPDAATIEHLLTGRVHGWTKWDNIAVACSECNGMRGSGMDWLTFKTYRRGEFWELIGGGKDF